MRILIHAGFAATVFVAARPADSPAQTKGDVGYRRLAAPLVIPMPGIALISDQRAWDLLWYRYHAGEQEDTTILLRSPYVDFTRAAALSLSLGHSGGCGSSSFIQSVRASGDTLNIEYAVPPNPDWEVIGCSGQIASIDIVVIPKPDRAPIIRLLPVAGSPLVPIQTTWWDNRGPRHLTGIHEAYHTAFLMAHARDPRTSRADLDELAEWVGARKNFELGEVVIRNPRIARSVLALTALTEVGDGVGRRALELLMAKHGVRAARDRNTSTKTLTLLIEQIRAVAHDRALVLALSRNPTVHSDSTLLTFFIPKAHYFVEPCLSALAVLRRRWIPDTTREDYRRVAVYCPPDPKRKLDRRPM